MNLACLVCHSAESPSHSFRSYSVSSSENEGTCSSMRSCLTRKVSIPHLTVNTCMTSSSSSTSKVTPQPSSMPDNGPAGPPRLVRSRAVRRDLVRDWNFNELLVRV